MTQLSFEKSSIFYQLPQTQKKTNLFNLREREREKGFVLNGEGEVVRLLKKITFFLIIQL